MTIEKQGNELVIKGSPQQIASVVSNCVLLTTLLLNQKDYGKKKTADLEKEYAVYQDLLRQGYKLAE